MFWMNILAAAYIERPIKKKPVAIMAAKRPNKYGSLTEIRCTYSSAAKMKIALMMSKQLIFHKSDSAGEGNSSTHAAR